MSRSLAAPVWTAELAKLRGGRGSLGDGDGGGGWAFVPARRTGGALSGLPGRAEPPDPAGHANGARIPPPPYAPGRPC